MKKTMGVKTIFIMALSVLVASCGGGSVGDKKQEQVRKTVCENNTREIRSSFILQCIENANPKSDEEPEDWIRHCQRMAEDTWCERKTVTIEYTCKREFLGGCEYWSETGVFGDKNED